MQIQNNPASPNFQAKLILVDNNVERFVKSSLSVNSKETFDTLDNFFVIYPDSVVTAGIKNVKNRDYLFVKNGATEKVEMKFIRNSKTVNEKDNSAFLDLIKRIMNKKSFWG